MKPRLIIIRGNSGSGKTTVAKRLRQQLGYGTMLVSQDNLRREIIRTKDHPGNPSIDLIYHTAMYGRKIGYNVVVEGILARKHYGEMLDDLIRDFDGPVLTYYFDLSFEETLRRHVTKTNAADFGETEMRQWWNDRDYLGVEDERYFDETLSEDEILRIIINDLGNEVTLVPYEELKRSDFENLLYYINNDHELNQRAPMGPADGKLGLDEFIEGNKEWCRRKGARLYAVACGGRVVGSISLILPRNGRAGTGYWLASEYWGAGVGRRAFELILAEAARVGATEIAATIANDNLPSLKLWRRHGAHEEPAAKPGMTRIILPLML